MKGIGIKESKNITNILLLIIIAMLVFLWCKIDSLINWNSVTIIDKKRIETGFEKIDYIYDSLNEFDLNCVK
jgi:hypothetical protein